MVPGLAEDPVGFDAAAAAATTATAAATSTASANDVPQDEAVEAVARAAREHYGRLVALLAATGVDITAAEDALADAFERAVRTWPVDGVPTKPQAWLLTVARNRLRDRWRSAEHSRTTLLVPEAHDPAVVQEVDVDAIPDHRLALMMVCAHPAIDRTLHTPLMLTTVLGCTAAQVGRAYAVPPATMATRLVRAKRRIQAAGIPFVVPDLDSLPDRLDAVLEAVYGALAVQWSTTGSEERELPWEAARLAEILVELVPAEPEARGLAALVELDCARRPARRGAGGRFVPLAEQDTTLWDATLIERAREHLRVAHGLGRLGRFQLEAAIQAVHCARLESGRTDWLALLGLHDALQQVAPSLGGAVAHAAVMAEVSGPAAALDRLNQLDRESGAAAARFQPALVLRAHLLERLDRCAEAGPVYDQAVALTHDPAERAHLERRRGGLGRWCAPSPGP